MKIYFKLCVTAGFFLILTGHNGSAQTPSGEDNVFNGIRAEMESVVEENKKLAAENKILKTQLVGLQLEVEKSRQDIEELDPEYSINEEARYEKKGISGGWNNAEDDALIREAQDIYLSCQSMNLDEEQRLQELYLYDLQYQKQELQLDLKLKQIQHRKEGKKQRPELNALQNEIEENLEKKEELSFKITEQEKAALAYPQKIDLLKRENKALKQRIDKLKRAVSK